jgi:triosephosphate isomerase
MQGARAARTIGAVTRVCQTARRWLRLDGEHSPGDARERTDPELHVRYLIAGNWKMNPATLEQARGLAQAVRAGASGECDLLVCPPFTALAAVADVLRGSRVALGGQDCHAEARGAHTGDISAGMLRDTGASHVILGHSERRANHAELDETVRQKVVAAMAAGLTPIVCVGETEEQRLSGRETEIIGWQLEGSLPKDFAGVIAYEPVWAIGTGRTPSVADVAMMHAFIFEELNRQFGRRADAWPILYGGSVKRGNAASLMGIQHVGGALVGGASLTAAEFLGIAQWK